MPTEPWRNPPPAPTLDEVRQRVSPQSMLLELVRAWWPALLWAIFIFTMSTDTFSSEHTSHFFEPLLRWFIPSLTEDQFDVIHHFIRKSAHFIEYFIFFLLLYRAVRSTRHARGWQWSSALVAWLIAASYSALDEIHQIFVPSRGPSPWDSLLDSTGALIALLVLFILYRRSLQKSG
jgi:VanZ family protein